MPTQQSIAEHLDISQQAVSQLMAEFGIDWRNTNIDAIRIAYIRRLREQAAGRAAQGDLALATERAALARAQRAKVERENAVAEGHLAPVALLESVLARAASKTAGIFDSIPGQVRRRLPDLPAEAIDIIASEIAKIRNTVSTLTLADIDPEEGGES